MRRILSRACVWFAFLVIFGSAGSSQSSSPVTSLEREASPGGTVRMQLSAGGYTVRPSRDNKIRLRWDTRNEEDLASVKVRVEVHGKEATIRTEGPRNNFRVDIEIPGLSDLHARLTAGELRIEGIEGSKDIEAHAGDLDIEAGKPESYSRVDASVFAGDLNAARFRISKGGLWRSFHWQGPGKYTLHAHVGAGELRIY